MKIVATGILIFAFASATGSAGSDPSFAFRLDPTQTYLRSGPPPSTNTPLQLSQIGAQPGQMIRLEAFGTYDRDGSGINATDSYGDLLGLFSKTATLLTHTEHRRVPGAISAGPTHQSKNVWIGGMPTDIPEDFNIGSGIDVIIPEGAEYLFFSPDDSQFHDNSDPDLNYGVKIIVPPTPKLVIVEEKNRAKRGDKINIVFVPEGYTSSDMSDFANHVDQVRSYLVSREPWVDYREYLNFFRIEVTSAEDGTDYGERHIGKTRDTYFDSYFDNIPKARTCYLTEDGERRARNLIAQLLPEASIRIILVNDPKWGGAAGQLAVSTVVPTRFPHIVEHEIGHLYADLADEYYPKAGETDPHSGNLPTPQEKANNTSIWNRSQIPWINWIDPQTSTPTTSAQTNHSTIIGLFEGSMYHETGWYRPHFRSMMKDAGWPVGHINREAIVRTFYESRRIRLLEWHSSTEPITIDRPTNINFRVQPMFPDGPPLKATWKVNGNTISEGNKLYEFVVGTPSLRSGDSEISVIVEDPTESVRDVPRGTLSTSASWRVTVKNQLPATLASWRASYRDDLHDPSNDGVANIIKYKIGLDPAVPITAGDLIKGQRTLIGGVEYLAATVNRVVRRDDVKYIIEVSEDLIYWRTGEDHVIVMEDTQSKLLARATLPLETNRRLFMRLRIAPQQ